MSPAEIYDFYPWGVAWRVTKGGVIRRCEGCYSPPPDMVLRIVEQRPDPEPEPELHRQWLPCLEVVPTMDRWRDDHLADGWTLVPPVRRRVDRRRSR